MLPQLTLFSTQQKLHLQLESTHYSRATSKASNLRGLAAWAAVKGIDVVATGDFTHPAWFAQLCDELEPAEPGFFKLKNNEIIKTQQQLTTIRNWSRKRKRCIIRSQKEPIFLNRRITKAHRGCSRILQGSKYALNSPPDSGQFYFRLSRAVAKNIPSLYHAS